jgi:phosphoribosylaminoimidazolecarboxamide formyltransferase/IMP cyclohydrolase
MITALISIYDKTGLVEFLNKLKSFDKLRIIATTSTAEHLKKQGFDCTPVEDLTKFPEILGGRVKTLHPKIFGGILARSTDEDEQTCSQFDIWKIDLVIVNLYPFEEKLNEKLTEAQMIEYIDIGGVSLLRAAAKNFNRVTVVSRASQLAVIEKSLEQSGGIFEMSLRCWLAREAFERTANYDRAIADYLRGQTGGRKQDDQNKLPESLTITLNQYQKLRYGENPHQAATWYATSKVNGQPSLPTFPPFSQLQGKELSSNNITDTWCLVKILRDIKSPAACIIKHNNPCGVAIGKTLEEAYDKAYNTDPTSAFGGIYGFTEKLNGKIAAKIVEGFVEIVAAPDFDEEALTTFRAKKNVRVLRFNPAVLTPSPEALYHLRDLQEFGFILERDVEPPVEPTEFEGGDSVARCELAPPDMSDTAFAWSVVKHLTSNAIFVAKNGCSLGFGIGQTSRIASVEIALKQAGTQAKGAVMASDAFFPATDNIVAAAKAGVSIIVQPGGSLKDKDVIAACNEAGIKMFFTGQRCFKH